MATVNVNNLAASSAVLLATLQAMTDAHKNTQDGAKEPEVYNMTSGLFPCVCVAMYETILSPTFFEEHMNEGEDEFYYNTVNSDDWEKALTEAAQDYLDDSIIDVLRNYGVLSIEAEGIWSPQYYNYNTDQLVMDITMVHDWQEIMTGKVAAWQQNDDVKSYIREHWRSYSGFVNFMPETLDEVLTEDDEERQLAAYLTLALVAEGVDMNRGNMIEDLYWRMEGFSDYERKNVIEEYYDDVCEAEKLMELWNNDDNWNELYWNLREKIGSPWRRDSRYDSLDGIKDCFSTFNADSDGKRMLFWAVKNEMTVEELYRMAA